MALKHCPECRYNLTGLPADHVCPECGLAYSADWVLFESRKKFAAWRLVISLCMGIGVVNAVIHAVVKRDVREVVCGFPFWILLGMFVPWLGLRRPAYILLTKESLVYGEVHRDKREIPWASVYVAEYSERGEELHIIGVDGKRILAVHDVVLGNPAYAATIIAAINDRAAGTQPQDARAPESTDPSC